MSEEFTQRYFDVQAAVGAVPVGKYQSTAIVETKLIANGHYATAVSKELCDTVAKMPCADIDGELGTKRQSIFRLCGVSRQECPVDCHYLQGGINCILYLMMINRENARLINAELAKGVVFGCHNIR